MIKSSPQSPVEGSNLDNDVPPPLPKRNRPQDAQNNKKPFYENGKVPLDITSMFLGHETNLGPLPRLSFDKKTSKITKSLSDPNSEIMIDNSLYSDVSVPPPLPPRAPLSNTGSSDPDAVNSINKQMSYPLVATCTPLVNNYVSNIFVDF